MGFHRRAVGIGEHAHGAGFFRRSEARGAGFARVRKDRRGRLGNAFLQQQVGRPQHGIGQKAALHRLVEQHVRQRQQAHAFVVRHELPHGDAAPRPAATAKACNRPLRRSHRRLAGRRPPGAPGCGRPPPARPSAPARWRTEQSPGLRPGRASAPARARQTPGIDRSCADRWCCSRTPKFPTARRAAGHTRSAGGRRRDRCGRAACSRSWA